MKGRRVVGEEGGREEGDRRGGVSLEGRREGGRRAVVGEENAGEGEGEKEG